MHVLRDAPNVVDIRTLGLTAAIEFAPRPGQPEARGYAAVEHAFFERDTVLPQAGDTIALTPPLIERGERGFACVHDPRCRREWG